jgi:hypothetical protein
MKLTGFQSMMTFWERWHAVNAVQFVELDQTPDKDRLRTAVTATLRKLEQQSVDGCWRLRYGDPENGFAQVVEDRREVLHSDQELESFITKQMNRPFDNREIPVRIGVLNRDESTILWICYRHSIADARSIAMLMQHLLDELCSDSTSDPALRLTSVSMDHRTRSEDLCRGLYHRFTAAVRSLLALQKCVRRKPHVVGRFEMTFQLHGESLPLSTLRHRATGHNSTIGELLTASLLEWLHRSDGSSMASPRPQSRAVSVLGDLASRTDATARVAFSQNICPFTVIDAAPDASVEERVATVRQQLRGANNLTAAQDNLNGLLWNSQLLKLLPRPLAVRNQEILFPIAGAVSNVNLNAMLLPERTESHVTTYWRSTCATQFCPVIVCLTTFQDNCTLTSTHLNSYYSDSEIRSLGRFLLARLFDVKERQIMRESPIADAAPPALTVAAF